MWGPQHCPVSCAPRLALKALGARWQAGERVGWANGCNSALCARGLIANEGRARCNVQNAPFLPRMVHDPRDDAAWGTRRARCTRFVRCCQSTEQGTEVALGRYASPRVRVGAALRSALTAIGAWEVRIVVELGVLRMYAISD